MEALEGIGLGTLGIGVVMALKNPSVRAALGLLLWRSAGRRKDPDDEA